MKNYFVASHVYPEQYVRRRFRMGTELFKSIGKAMKLHDSFLRKNGIVPDILDIAPSKRVTAALRMMAHGSPMDLVDDKG
jgi:hypothetical protein